VLCIDFLYSELFMTFMCKVELYLTVTTQIKFAQQPSV